MFKKYLFILLTLCNYTLSAYGPPVGLLGADQEENKTKNRDSREALRFSKEFFNLTDSQNIYNEIKKKKKRPVGKENQCSNCNSNSNQNN